MVRKVNAMTTYSPTTEDVLKKEAGRELAAFLLAVEQTQGAGTVENAGTIWLDIFKNRPSSDCCSQSSFRRITVEAASSLFSRLEEASPEMDGGPDYDVTYTINPRKIHLLVAPEERTIGAQRAGHWTRFSLRNRRSAEAASGSELAP
jgi:hypothetical protein